VKRNVNQRMVSLTDLDHRVNDDTRMKPSNDVTEWQLAGDGQNTRLEVYDSRGSRKDNTIVDE